MSQYNLVLIGNWQDGEALEEALFSLAGRDLADREVCVEPNTEFAATFVDTWGIARPSPYALADGYLVFGDIDQSAIVDAEKSGRDMWLARPKPQAMVA